jgi:hypothetical protein
MNNIDKLVAEYDKIDNALFREAAADLLKEQRERKKKALIRALSAVDALVSSRVATLRDIRKRERAIKTDLERVVNARANFLKTADVEVFAKEAFDSNSALGATFLREFAELKNS